MLKYFWKIQSKLLEKVIIEIAQNGDTENRGCAKWTDKRQLDILDCSSVCFMYGKTVRV